MGMTSREVLDEVRALRRDMRAGVPDMSDNEAFQGLQEQLDEMREQMATLATAMTQNPPNREPKIMVLQVPMPVPTPMDINIVQHYLTQRILHEQHNLTQFGVPQLTPEEAEIIQMRREIIQMRRKAQADAKRRTTSETEDDEETRSEGGSAMPAPGTKKEYEREPAYAGR